MAISFCQDPAHSSWLAGPIMVLLIATSCEVRHFVV